ncbi:hypothetical protein [Chryseobacterium indologenes]|uniref:hypothetical protein n=1 Tax=Chryseobacterium TaxID=59732 RepID=UPI001BCD3F39|nr:hypothetical protein [Chryseobacterium indologenes]WPO89410.1 hypothetical protein SFA27_14335 [Chryseobacterium sp. HR92]
MKREEVTELTPEKVVKVLKEKGTIVNIEEAKAILSFIKAIANIAVNQYLSGRDLDFMNPKQ